MQENYEFDSEEEDNPWSTIIYGIGCFIVAYFVFDYCSNFESTGSNMHGGKSKWILALLYNLGGKWVPTLILSLIGIGLIGFGIHDFTKKQK